MIREVVSSAILSELRDPRIRNVTVLGADVSPDLRYASVKISVMGDDKMAALTMHGLESARGFLQSKVAEFIKSKYTPELRFVVDDGIRKSLETSTKLREVLSVDSERGNVLDAEVAGIPDDDLLNDDKSENTDGESQDF